MTKYSTYLWVVIYEGVGVLTADFVVYPKYEEFKICLN